MKNLIITGYITANLLYALKLFSCLMRQNGPSRFLPVMPLAFNGLVLVCISRVLPAVFLSDF